MLQMLQKKISFEFLLLQLLQINFSLSSIHSFHSIHSHFDNTAKPGTNLENSAAGGGELFEKFQQKQKINKDSSNSMGGKR